MSVEFRAIEPDEYPELVRTMGLAFGFDPPEDDDFRHLLPLERTVVGFDGARMVSTAAAFSLDMTIPGGTVECGGTTIVSVVPTHRRQGLLRGMMRSHLDDVLSQGEPIAALWASDSAIYGRFGFGQAATHYDISVRRDHVEFHRSAPQPAPVRLIDSGEAQSLLLSFYDCIRKSTPGFYARSPLWWEHRILADPEKRRNGATAYRFEVVDDADGIAGYVQYRVKSDWDDSHGAGKVLIKDLFGTTPESWSGLWSYILNQDLIAEITAHHRSVQDPLFDLLAGTRRAKAQRFDNLWVRIMDVPRALEARSYSAPVDVVVEVHDPIGDIDGRYHLVASTEGAQCQRTDAEASISLDAEDLGGIYMGRSRLRALSRIGRLQGDPAALTAADAAFTWEPQPWCPEVF
ncbi:MAG: GNAT family N-acetyltransferase [Acidimicrobiia bacterium]